MAGFLKTSIWNLAPAHRVLTLLNLGQQNDIGKKLRADDPAHMCLVLMATRALAMNLGLLISGLNVVDVLNVEERLREELHGGAELLAQKVRYANAIHRLTGQASAERAVDHDGFPLLLEEVNRLLIRRYALNDAIRVTDLALHYSASGVGSLPRNLSGSEGALSSKMASDILSLFVKSNALAPEFSRAILNLLASQMTEVGNETVSAKAAAAAEERHLALLAPLPPIDSESN
jgi:hypothetical protein